MAGRRAASGFSSARSAIRRPIVRGRGTIGRRSSEADEKSGAGKNREERGAAAPRPSDSRRRPRRQEAVNRQVRRPAADVAASDRPVPRRTDRLAPASERLGAGRRNWRRQCCRKRRCRGPASATSSRPTWKTNCARRWATPRWTICSAAATKTDQEAWSPTRSRAGKVVAIRRDDVFVELPGRQQGIVSLRQFDVPPQIDTRSKSSSSGKIPRTASTSLPCPIGPCKSTTGPTWWKGRWSRSRSPATTPAGWSAK